MRWRLLDRVTGLQPWQAIEGTKAVSLEEYLLLEPFGREGVLPESLVLGACEELACWLAAVSSGFRQEARLVEVQKFGILGETLMGSVLRLEARVVGRVADQASLECVVSAGEVTVARGYLVVRLQNIAIDGLADELRAMWETLSGAA